MGAQSGGNFVKVILTSLVAGSQTIKVTPLDSNGIPLTPITQKITWTSSGSTAATTISAYLIDTATGHTSAAGIVDSTVPLSYSNALSSGASVPKAEVIFLVKDANGTAVNAASCSVTVSGPGLISALAGSTYPNSTPSVRVAAITTGATGYIDVEVGSDGSSGVGTVTATCGTATASRSITWTGLAASYSAGAGVGYLAVGANGADATYNNYAIAVTAKDSAGQLVTQGTMYAVSSDKTVATVTASQSTGAVSGHPGVTYWAVTGVKAGTATITFQNTDPTGTTAPTVTTTQKVEVTSSTIDKLTAALDKTSYAPGEKVSFQLTATNAAGRPVADGTYYVFSALTPLSTNLQVQPNADGGVTGNGQSLNTYSETSVAFVGGIGEINFYAPVVPGTLTVSGTTRTATTVTADLSQNVRSQVVTASASVVTTATGGDAALALDAANAATDAANNAYDEAQNATQAAQDALAAVTALADQVKSLIASVKALSASFAKIKAKVHA